MSGTRTLWSALRTAHVFLLDAAEELENHGATEAAGATRERAGRVLTVLNSTVEASKADATPPPAPAEGAAVKPLSKVEAMLIGDMLPYWVEAHRAAADKLSKHIRDYGADMGSTERGMVTSRAMEEAIRADALREFYKKREHLLPKPDAPTPPPGEGA